MMTNSFLQRNLIKIISLSILALLIVSCANVGMPTGGPKDTTPPVIVESLPQNFSVNFAADKIQIKMDEYIKTKDLSKQLVISPPMDTLPEISIKGKSIIIELKSRLEENTTYSINLGNSILDNNEGNIYENLRYVFSTGPTLDSLQVSGTIYDSYTHQPVEAAVIMLYKDLSDSIIMKKKPFYVGRSNKNGKYSIQNISDTTYQILALVDINNNYLYDSPDEQIAFIDSFIHPYVTLSTKIDTLKIPIKQEVDSLQKDTSLIAKTDTLTQFRDSIVSKEIAQYFPDSLSLNLFQEEDLRQYLLSSTRDPGYKIQFVFNSPNQNKFEISPLFETESSTYRLIENASKDTFNLWLLDSSIYKQDSLKFQIFYERTDSVLNLVPERDTIIANYRETTPVTKLNLTTNLKKIGATDLGEKYYLQFDAPIEFIDSTKIIVLKSSDSSFVNTEYLLTQDSLDPLKYHFQFEQDQSLKYKISFLDSAFVSYFQTSSDSLGYVFSYKAEDSYGNLILTFPKMDETLVVELIDDKMKSVRTTVLENDTRLIFKNLNPAKYSVRVILDENKNGKWDTGNYLRRKQTEQTFYPLKDLQIKANWDLEMDVNLPLQQQLEESESTPLE